jgi:hypothetical protein
MMVTGESRHSTGSINNQGQFYGVNQMDTTHEETPFKEN